MDQLTVKYAGFWRRCIATVVDGLIVGVPFILLSFLVGRGFFYFMSGPTSVWGGIYQIVSFGLMIGYEVWFVASRSQATPGKRLMDMYVGDAATGARIGYGRAFGRWGILNIGLFLVTIASMFMATPRPNVSPADLARWNSLITSQLVEHRQLTPEEQAFANHVNDEMMASMLRQAKLSEDEISRYNTLQHKLEAHETLADEDVQFMKSVGERLGSSMGVLQAINLLNGLFLIVNAFMIGCSHQKAGIHDRVTKTRVFRGRVFTAADAKLVA